MLSATIILAASLLTQCYYNPIPISVTGNLTCKYKDSRAFAGTIWIKGEGITDGWHKFDPQGTWTLCSSSEPVQCTVSTHTSTSSP